MNLEWFPPSCSWGNFPQVQLEFNWIRESSWNVPFPRGEATDTIHFLRAYDSAICILLQSIHFLRAYDSAIWLLLQSIHFLCAYDSAIWILLQSIHFLRAYDSAICILLQSIHFLRAYDSAIWNLFAVDSLPACLRFSNMNSFAVLWSDRQSYGGIDSPMV